MKKMKNATANHLTFADVTGNLEEVFEDTKTVESKSESGTITTNATDGETRYVKPLQPPYRTGYVFEIEDTLVVASSMAKAIELYCLKKHRTEEYIKKVKRIGCGVEGNFGTSVNYDAIIEG